MPIFTTATLAMGGTRTATASPPDERRWAIGIEATALSAPRGHLGLFANAGNAITPELVARYEVGRPWALNVGFGLLHSSMGLGGWASWEIFAPVVANEQGTWVLSLFEQSGLQLGYAGPDYYARHGGDFVGYEYSAAGPLAFTLRFPIGVNLRWASGYVDTYVAAVPIIALTPDMEALYNATLGNRFRF